MTHYHNKQMITIDRVWEGDWGGGNIMATLNIWMRWLIDWWISQQQQQQRDQMINSNLIMKRRDWRLTFGSLTTADDAADSRWTAVGVRSGISPANVSIGSPECSFALLLRFLADGQVALDAQTNWSLDATARVFRDDQLAEFRFEGFIESVLIGFGLLLLLETVDVLRCFQLRRMSPAASRRRRRRRRRFNGGLGRLLVVVVAFGEQWSHWFNQL